MMSLRILLTAWPKWIAPFAYGGPSVSTNEGRPLAVLRIFSYKPLRSHAASIPGSRLARSAFIGKPVFGKLIVFL